MGILSPALVGILYMMVTGHGKGYDYDLRGETEFFIGIGVIGLILYLCLAIPGFLWSGREFFRTKRKTALLPCFLFGLGFFFSVFRMGFGNFLSFFAG